MNDLPYSMSLEDARAYVGLQSLDILRRAVKGKGLPSRRAGSKYLVRRADLEAWVDSDCPIFPTSKAA